MFIAHIDEKNGSRTQSVSEHCRETANKAARYAEKLSLCKTALLQGLLHDMGKLCNDFNEYITQSNDLKRGDIDHAYAGAKYLFETASHSSSSYEKIISGYIARTIISHHGLHDWLDEDGKSCFDKRISKSERYSEILNNKNEIFSDEKIIETLTASAEEYKIYHKKIKLCSANDLQKYLFYSGLFERILQSILIDADRTDTADFMTGRPTEREFDTKKVWDTASKNLAEKYKRFSAKKDEITKRRTQISERCLEFAEHNVGICRLIVPTGGGKTLSSLRFAVEYCKRSGKERIFYIAPFMSILEQNSDVIREIAGEENFLEHYSDLAQNIDGKDELCEYELRTEKWDTPVISTTLVQFLNTIFSNKTACVRRFHRLANSVIIIDEVQAIPLKCVNLFNLAVNFLANICGSTVVLCTATQPSLNKTSFPVEFDDIGDMNPGFKDDFEAFHRTDLIPVCRPNGYSYEEAAEFCAEKFEENGNLLLVVNTKTAAANIFDMLKQQYGGDVLTVHLSTGMCPEHRRDILKLIRAELERERPLICVTTQLIEAGVDISFKCVVRSLAGLDNAAQAAGRCNRNGEYPVCPAYIINIRDERLRNLQEISHRQDAALSVINKAVHKNLLDTDAMSEYFDLFYKEQEDQLSFKAYVDRCWTTLVDILSLNTQRNSLSGRSKPSERIGTQSFKTAGEKFIVIDSSTEEVLVPYNDEARELISQLDSELTISETADKLRRAQKYTVSVYSNQISILTEKNAVYRTASGVLALDERFYDSRGIGLNLSGGNLEELFF